MALLQTLQSAITSIPIVEQYFLNPLGLLGLLALIPLAIFYLVKPKPEQKVMPSMRFFHEEDGSSQLRSALRTILRNLTLLLQILIVLGFAAALAQPFTTVLEQPENSVIILDRSASMQNDFNEAKKFVKSRLGEKNTLIVADSDVEVKAEKAPPARIKEILKRVEPADTETDVASAIDTARGYRGRLVIASNLDQTSDSRDISQLLTSQSTRPVDVLETSETNKWGITGLEIGDNSTEVEITSFMEGKSTLEVKKDREVREISLQADETIRISFQNQKGRNRINLPEDGLEVDNTAYYVIPETKGRKIRYLGPENRYFSKAIDLASGLAVSGDSADDTDIYILGGETEKGELENIASEVEEGASAVVLKDSRGLRDVFGFDTSYEAKNFSVRLNYPQRIDVGRTEVLDRGLESGTSLSKPDHAVKIHDYGEGKILAYNLDESEFRYSFLYPVFWKSALMRVSDVPTSEELNLETGETLTAGTLETPSGQSYSDEAEVNETGFYSSGETVYASNLLSEDESSQDGENYDTPNQRKLQKSSQSVQSLAVMLLVVLISTELTYLWYRGDI
jgi:hypothetical protein